ncbi:hypothetical protein VKT23_018610 [Stygiomarasmius scandens]|uniref:Uncharacterized protein n=1 Tax=Marasmiellus scandens TaxID=2682957 RepID=A0ABR1INJ0_9AGAR
MERDNPGSYTPNRPKPLLQLTFVFLPHGHEVRLHDVDPQTDFPCLKEKAFCKAKNTYEGFEGISPSLFYLRIAKENSRISQSQWRLQDYEQHIRSIWDSGIEPRQQQEALSVNLPDNKNQEEFTFILKPKPSNLNLGAIQPSVSPSETPLPLSATTFHQATPHGNLQTDHLPRRVDLLYTYLKLKRVLQLKGIPGAGKSTYLAQLKDYIRSIPHAKPPLIISIDGWPQSEEHGITFKARVSTPIRTSTADTSMSVTPTYGQVYYPPYVSIEAAATVVEDRIAHPYSYNPDISAFGDIFIVHDKAQRSYRDLILWDHFYADCKNTNIYVITTSDWGSDSSISDLDALYPRPFAPRQFGTPKISLNASEQIGMTRNPSLIPAFHGLQLLLSYQEYLTLQRHLSPRLIIDDELLPIVYALSGGHIATVRALHNFFVHKASHILVSNPQEMTAEQTLFFSCAMLEDALSVSFRGVTEQSLLVLQPQAQLPSTQQDAIDFVSLMRGFLRKGIPPEDSELPTVISDRDLRFNVSAFLRKLVQEVEVPFNKNNLPLAVRHCIMNGWATMKPVVVSRLDRAYACVNDTDVPDVPRYSKVCIITFPTPLHRYLVADSYLRLDKTTKYQDVFSFVTDVLKRFSPTRLKRFNDLGYGITGYHYQMEFYCCCDVVYSGMFSLNLERSVDQQREGGTGRIDLLVAGKKWGIQLFKDGKGVQEYLEAIRPGICDNPRSELSGHVMLDCRRDPPTDYMYGHYRGKLLYAVFSKDWTQLDLIHADGEPILQSNLKHHDRSPDPFDHFGRDLA